MASVVALIVPVDESSSTFVSSVDPTDHQALLRLVGDSNTDAVFLVEVPGVVFVGENSKRREGGDRVNVRATQIVNRFVPDFAKHDWVQGPAVFFGVDAEGGVVDVPGEVLGFVGELFAPPVAR